MSAAKRANTSATHHDRPLARVWSRIAHIVGDDLASMVNSGKLVWMPAHKSHHAVGVAALSNGLLLTTVEVEAMKEIMKEDAECVQGFRRHIVDMVEHEVGKLSKNTITMSEHEIGQWSNMRSENGRK